MAALSRVLRSIGSPGNHGIAFWCPGCRGAHVIYYQREGPGPLWRWDGNAEAPTISPSILVTYSGTDAGEDDAPPERCHSFVRAGRIEFLGDCTHELAGRTVPIPDFPENFAT